jgi:hypothetical protein
MPTHEFQDLTDRNLLPKVTTLFRPNTLEIPASKVSRSDDSLKK